MRALIDPVIDNSWSNSLVAITSMSKVCPHSTIINGDKGCGKLIVFSHDVVAIFPESPFG